MVTCLFTQRHPGAVARIARVVIAISALNGQESLMRLLGVLDYP
jgi:hypothetical protein